MKRGLVFCFLWMLLPLCALELHGYRDCIELRNGQCRVVVTGALGCRVLEFSFRGRNAVLVNPRHDGAHWSSGPERFSPSGGRFDVGPELTVPEHASLWLGTWAGRKSSPLSMTWRSPDGEAPFEVVREFTLDAALPKLTIRQTVSNRSGKPLLLHHWGRGWFQPGGTVIVPLPPKELRRFPKGFVQYENEPRNWIVNLLPEDPAVSEAEGCLLVKPLPAYSKNTFECGNPWAGYRLPYGQLLIVRFALHPERASAEIAGGNFSICFNRWFCEMEPIGPRETVAPGGTFSFTEEWELFECSLPSEKMIIEAIEKGDGK